jgi:hypothetical protein
MVIKVLVEALLRLVGRATSGRLDEWLDERRKHLAA